MIIHHCLRCSAVTATTPFYRAGDDVTVVPAGWAVPVLAHFETKCQALPWDGITAEQGLPLGCLLLVDQASGHCPIFPKGALWDAQAATSMRTERTALSVVFIW